MAKLSREIVVLSAKRTPFGALSGALKSVTATDLAVHAATSALSEAKVSLADVSQSVFGNVQQTSPDAIYLARHVGLKSGLPVNVPALTLNRLCGSGFQAVVTAAEQILLGEGEVILCGGTENMSQAPHILRGARDGFAFGKAPALEDSLWSSLTDSYCNLPMALTAENLAEQYGLTRADCDQYALTSQQRWAAAHEAKRFSDELVSVSVAGRKESVTVTTDEHPRPQTTIEGLSKLNPVFKKDGVVTAGNASGICDGAAALVLASGDYARAKGLKPLARVLQWGISGVEPKIMGIGPAPAIRSALSRAEMSLSQIDLVEVNEAFAPQYLAVEKELGLDREKTNVDGGAIALGHPLGASGARITAHLVHSLRNRGLRYGLGSACIGGGQGIAVLIEAL